MLILNRGNVSRRQAADLTMGHSETTGNSEDRFLKIKHQPNTPPHLNISLHTKYAAYLKFIKQRLNLKPKNTTNYFQLQMFMIEVIYGSQERLQKRLKTPLLQRGQARHMFRTM